MLLLLTRPDLYLRDCKHCWLYQYIEKPQEGSKENRGDVRMRAGRPVKRFAAILPPCVRDECPKGTIDNPTTLHPKNLKAYRHYLECKAVGHFPNDPIVRRNAAIISEVIHQVERREMLEMMAMGRYA